VNPAFWNGRSVLLTGHTGFKGSWLTLWLRELGAAVTGYSLEPPTYPSLFTLAGVHGDCRDLRGDIGDTQELRKAFSESRPEIVFHLAAQPLVREAYRNPKETWRVNVMGTLEVLEACEACDSVQTVVVITTDKVYENSEQGLPFQEEEALGGHDPYSSSKAACEILCASWRRSFWGGHSGKPQKSGRPIHLATARAGNVVGGGDFAAERLIPDLMRACIAGKPVRLRYPKAVRPWQHVLEPLSGYLLLAEQLHTLDAGPAEHFSHAFNFGPRESDLRPVEEVADAVCRFLKTRWEWEEIPQPHEAGLLRLDSRRARISLGWSPRLNFEDMLGWTCGWYADWQNGEDPRALTLAQIRNYPQLPRLETA